MGYVMEFTSIFHEAVITEDKSDIARMHAQERADQKERSERGRSKVRGGVNYHDYSMRARAMDSGMSAKRAKRIGDSANNSKTEKEENKLRKTRHESTFLDSIELI